MFRYWREARGAFDSMAFGRIRYLGTIDAIRYALLHQQGVAMLPSYFVAADLRAGRLQLVMPRVRPSHDCGP